MTLHPAPEAGMELLSEVPAADLSLFLRPWRDRPYFFRLKGIYWVGFNFFER
jgi:hypothetical protein